LSFNNKSKNSYIIEGRINQIWTKNIVEEIIRNKREKAAKYNGDTSFLKKNRLNSSNFVLEK